MSLARNTFLLVVAGVGCVAACDPGQDQLCASAIEQYRLCVVDQQAASSSSCDPELARQVLERDCRGQAERSKADGPGWWYCVTHPAECLGEVTYEDPQPQPAPEAEDYAASPEPAGTPAAPPPPERDCDYAEDWVGNALPPMGCGGSRAQSCNPPANWDCSIARWSSNCARCACSEYAWNVLGYRYCQYRLEKRGCAFSTEEGGVVCEFAACEAPYGGPTWHIQTEVNCPDPANPPKARTDPW